MNRREKWTVIFVAVATVTVATASYFFDRWVLASGLPDWLKSILMHGPG